MSTAQIQTPAGPAPKQVKKRAAPRTRKDMAPKKPKIVKPPPTSLAELPEEVLGVIAHWLTRAAQLDESGLISPLDRPYAPHHKAITANHAFRNERFGAIPTSLIDLVSFSRSCRKAMKVSLKMAGSFGMSRKSEGVRFDPIACLPKRQLFIRMDHIGETGNNLTQLMLDNREVLEEVVLYACGSHNDNKARHSGHEISDPASPFNLSDPLQERFKNEAPLPKLKRIQLGPDLCIACVRVALRLFTAKRFLRRTSAHNEPQWDIATGLFPNWNSIASVTFDHFPAPELKSIQVISPDMLSGSHRVTEADRVQRTFDVIPADMAKQIEILSVVLRGQLDRRWGGFGVAGGTSRMNAKTREQAEADLTERARLYMLAPGTSAWERQKEEKDKGAVAKYADKLKAAKAKAAPASKDEDLLAVVAAAISTIQGKGETSTGAPAVNALPVPVKAIINTDSEAKLDKGKGKADPPATLDIAAMQDGVDPVLEDASDTDTDPDVKAESDDNGAPTKIRRRKIKDEDSKDILSAHDRNAIANHIRMEDHITSILSRLANRFPNLVSLQVVRGGSNRTDVLEGEDSIERMLRACVVPLANLVSLRHLDLGLAVLGIREARDFPIGLHVPKIDPVKVAAQVGPTQARSMMLRKRIHETDILKAVKEGDAWRKKVIERFALGVRQDAAGDATPPVTWPKSIRSGFVYSPDLIERVKYRGFLMCWEKDVVNGQETLKWKRHNVIL